MPKEHATFHSVNGKRLVLVVDDELVNREILKAVLESDYEVIVAEDGEIAMRKIRENADMLSLVLLDLMMPNMPGQEVLRRAKALPETQNIPIIVASGDWSQEIECLNAGASDFIQKPYPEAGVIKARVLRAIELNEDRQIIQSTERDPLTGLYNWEFFIQYAEQYDQYHKGVDMDALVIDITHFAIINERYGRAYADDVLRCVGDKVRELVHDSDGIVCRRGADTFHVYCPHRDDYKAILDNVTASVAGGQGTANRVRLRMGVYSLVDKSLDIERRFDRAKMAADTVRTSYTRNIGVYDDTLHKAELYAEQLIEDFPRAIEEHQFSVFYQPKFNIRGDVPTLHGAEALVRWRHPGLGMISPGVFIPLFEENGLIETLDNYVWEEAARQIRQWKDELGFSVPVSVNVSRVDMYNPNIVYTLLTILEEHGLDEGDLHLEVTESAYAEDSDQIISTVTRLRGIGFNVEMDDFGTGYSSLNMLATLPIDALKLDMAFVRTALSQEDDIHMLKVIVDIARHLRVPVVAEGVETAEQLAALKEVECDIVQGYYFSEPVPAEKYRLFLTEEKQRAAEDEAAGARSRKRKKQTSAAKMSTDEERAAYSERWRKLPNIPLRTVSYVFMIVAFAVSAALFVSSFMVARGYEQMEQASERYIKADQAASSMEQGSDYLTENVRSFVITGDIQYLNNYFEELETTRQRDTAVANLEELLEGTDNEAHTHLVAALNFSNELVNYEYLAMKLVIEAGDYDEASIPDVLKKLELTPLQQALSPDEKRERAVQLVFDDNYAYYKERIMRNAAQSTESFIRTSDQARIEASERMGRLIAVQGVLTSVMFVIVVALVLYMIVWVRRPLAYMVELMRAKETVPLAGAQELRFVSETYNSIFEENRKTHERLTYGSTHDALTGLFNRTAYDIMREEIDMSQTALLLVDVDKFKAINDTYGHDVGDMVLTRVAEVLRYSFRSTDLLFRLGGDEFVVIMSNADSTMRDSVKTRIDQANVMLQKPAGDLPPTSLSVGVAFADRDNPDGDIFKDADTALYRVKQAGRCGCVIY